MSQDFQLGQHDQAIQSIQTDVTDLKRAVARIEATLHETKGGVRMLVTVGSVGGAIGAGIMKALAVVKGGQ